MTSLADQAVAWLSRRPSAERGSRAPGSRYGPGGRSALRSSGWETVGLVSGAAVYHVGLVGWPQGNAEVGQLSEVLNSGREAALTRLRAHASRLEADGVIDARLDVHFPADHRHLPRFVMVGTAIRRVHGRGREVRLRAEGNDTRPPDSDHPAPFTAAVTASQLTLLLEAGYHPVGMVMGTCVFHVGRRRFGEWASTQRENIEMTGYTTALYEARELAMTRLQKEALDLGATGVIGVTTAERSHIWGDHVIEFFASGTAVRPAAASPPAGRTPEFALPVTDPVGATVPDAIVRPGRSRVGARRS